jgi:hypothetical protein
VGVLSVNDIAPERPRPLRREEYELLVEHGRFDDEHVELLLGHRLIPGYSPLVQRVSNWAPARI